MLKFLVKNQRLETLKREVIASDQIAFVTVKFIFEGGWKSFHKVVQFTQEGETYNRVLGTDGTSCLLPSELHSGVVKMSLFGYDAENTDGLRATTVPVVLHIRPSGFVGDGNPEIPPTPDLYAQLLAQIGEIHSGASAYELAVESGYSGTLEEWLLSLKGDTGSDGENGVDGKDGTDGTSAYVTVEKSDSVATITATDANGTTTATITDGQNGSDGADGVDGKSAYELAVESGYSGTLDEWLLSLKGEDGVDGQNGADGVDGVDGKSAYELAVESGYSGTLEEWILSLKGENGTDGQNGSDGENGVDGKDGVDGTSAYVTVEKSDSVATITATDANGTTTAAIMDGQNGSDGADGADGKDGTDGTSAYVTVEKSDSVATITATDANGTTTAAIMDGQNGSDGTDGKDGADGQDGYSPTIEVFKQSESWTMLAYNAAYFGDDTSATTFDVSALNTVSVVLWWNDTGESMPLTFNFNNGGVTEKTETITLSYGESAELDVSDYDTIGIWTSAGIAATGQVIFNEETAESGYYLKITYQEDGEIKTLFTDNLKGADAVSTDSGWIDLSLESDFSSGTVQCRQIGSVMFVRVINATVANYTDTNMLLTISHASELSKVSPYNCYFPALTKSGDATLQAMGVVTNGIVGAYTVDALPAGTTLTFSASVPIE